MQSLSYLRFSSLTWVTCLLYIHLLCCSSLLVLVFCAKVFPCCVWVKERTGCHGCELSLPFRAACGWEAWPHDLGVKSGSWPMGFALGQLVRGLAAGFPHLPIPLQPGEGVLLSDHSEVKLEINTRSITEKSQNMWRLNNTFLSNTWVKEEISEEI